MPIGLGAPVLIATSTPLANALRTEKCATWVVGLFLGGVLLQVLIDFINKATNRYAYDAEEKGRAQHRRHQISLRLTPHWIIGGPDGAGKTTFANGFLRQEGACDVFVLADLIAAGLSPFAPECPAVRAARLMLEITDACFRGRHFVVSCCDPTAAEQTPEKVPPPGAGS